jgi:hypothetical protein
MRRGRGRRQRPAHETRPTTNAACSGGGRFGKFAAVFAARVISRTPRKENTVAHKSPLAIVKETFGDKAKLVQAVEALTGEALWVARTNKNKGLAHVSNAKLLRLHATFSLVKEKFGSREKLIDAILELLKSPKDAGLRQKLAAWPVPRLFDTYKSTEKRASARHPAAATAASSEGPAKASTGKSGKGGTGGTGAKEAPAEAAKAAKAANAKKGSKAPATKKAR